MGMTLPSGKALSQLIAAVLVVGNSPAFAEKLPTPGEFVQYLNPIHQKSYLNESQDRIIKKKSFKASKIEGVRTVSNREIGLFARIPADKSNDEAFIEQVLSKPEVNGVSCLLPWSLLEPTEETFNFQPVNKIIELCKKHGKTLILEISTCGIDGSATTSGAASTSDTPEWVFAAGTKSVDYPNKDGKQHKMPVFWDTTYLAKWANFINALGRVYDKNDAIHSIAITGGGTLASTNIVPNFTANKSSADEVESKLTKDFGMTPRQLVGHWKYVADIFPKAFPTRRLLFNIDPPVSGRKGQDCLDEISDYLMYRYGERIFLVREDVDAKHGFDQYRVMLKFRADTLTGYQLNPSIDDPTLVKITKIAGDDGISFAVIPTALLEKKDEAFAAHLNDLRSRLGYQLIAQEVTVSGALRVDQPLKAAFRFVNVGAATPKRPSRELDKDVPTSYKVQIRLVDKKGKSVMMSRHTPPVSTTLWTAGKPIVWQQELKMPKVSPGTYSVFLSIIDENTKRKLQLLNAMANEKPEPQFDIAVGEVCITQ
jgi:Beta-galactosidase